jgi:hypothetical protein
MDRRLDLRNRSSILRDYLVKVVVLQLKLLWILPGLKVDLLELVLSVRVRALAAI